jgi:Tfp pilus assembly protein PilV
MKQLGLAEGFSIVEVMASLTLFALVAAALATTSAGTIRYNLHSRDSTAASALVQDKIEDFRALDPGAADLTPGSHQDPLSSLDALGHSGGKFSRSWTVTADSPRRGLATVVVNVRWQDRGERSISGATYVCRTPTCS